MPSWVDVSVSDIDGARAFYSEIFGWDADVAPNPRRAATRCSHSTE
jgi:predicted enzyme related to lactoylglutathione lyase